MDQSLLRNLGLSRAMQQKIKKIPAQQLDQMLNKYGSVTAPNAELSKRQQFRQIINEKENRRLNYHPKPKPNIPDEPEIVLTPEEQKKKHQNRMKRLKSKFGQVSETDYYDALAKTTNLQPNQSDELQKYFNMIDLYHHQHPACVEKQLDLNLDADEDS